MRRQLNYSGSVFSKLLVLAFAFIVFISIAFKLRQHYDLFTISISVMAAIIISLILYINLFGERLEADKLFFYWKPVWSSRFIQFPLQNIKSAKVVSRPLLFDGLNLLMNCRIELSVGNKDIVIKFRMRRQDEELLNDLRNRIANKISDRHI